MKYGMNLTIRLTRNFIGQDSCFFILKRIYHHAKLVLECATRSRLKRGSAPPENLMFRHQ